MEGKNKFFNYISIALHPIFVPLYVTYIYLNIFGNVLTEELKDYLVKIIFVGTFVLPFLTIMVLKFFGFIDSVFLQRPKERYIPIVLSGVYIYITARLLMTASVASPLNSYLIGVVVTLSWILIFSKRLKVSLHTASVSSALGFLIYLSDSFMMNLSPIIISLILIVGIVSTSRIKLNAHTYKEILTGIVFGILPQLSFVFS